MNTEPFVIERTYSAPIERVWKALTDRESMRQWYFDIKDFKPEVGYEFHFTGENDGKVFMHLCKITDVIPNKKLRHSWRYEDYEGMSYVTWELFDEGDKTRVKLTHEGLETFPPIADFAKENFAAGWNYILGTSLKEFIE